MIFTVHTGDALTTLASLPDESVHCCVTSPPYFGLRDYGNDGQIGLETTPEAFISRLVGVFREVRRVLKNDGTLWVNMGDSYAAQRGGTYQPAETLAGGKGGKMDSGERVNRDRHDGYNPTRNAHAIGLKHKDLIGIPWMLAFALRADGWYLRSDIIWSKPNPMPESVTDRPTKAHEYVFLLSKSPKYYYDAEAIKEHCKQDWGIRDRLQGKYHNDGTGLQPHSGLEKSYVVANKRSVWEVTTKPYREAHFATYPPAPVGGVVLDPFTGSGTTGMVALEEGRQFIGVELNPEYAEMARRRIGGSKLSLFDAEGIGVNK
jgi:DNA modification methylase